MELTRVSQGDVPLEATRVKVVTEYLCTLFESEISDHDLWGDACLFELAYANGIVYLLHSPDNPEDEATEYLSESYLLMKQPEALELFIEAAEAYVKKQAEDLKEDREDHLSNVNHLANARRGK